MRIIYIADSIIPSQAANSVHVMKMSAALASLGHEVTLVVRSLPQRELSDAGDPFDFYGVPRAFVLHKVEPSLIFASKGSFALGASRWALRQRPEVVYTRSVAAGAFSALAGLPVIYESHTPERGSFGTLLYRLLRRSPNLRKHVVITEALKRHYEEKGLSTAALCVAPDGADVPSTATPASLGSADRPKVGYVGHLYAGRGIDLILELARRITDADFHFIGGTVEDVAMWKKEAGTLGNVTFHGFLPPGDLDGYRQSFDILLAPYGNSVAISGRRGLDTARWMSPLKVFEYMAAGKPFVVSRLEVIEEVVEDDVTAVLASPDDVDEWESAIRGLIDDPEKQARIGRTARRVFEENYTWSKRAEKILTVALGRD